MDDLAAVSGPNPLVAVVGGGASATLMVAHLLRHDGPVPHVVVIDRRGLHGRGQAYSTEDPSHLLNARAANMSGLHDDPGHLLAWVREGGIEACGDDFLPRSLYGRYLRDLLDTSAQRRPAGQVSELTGTALSLTADPAGAGWRLHLADGTCLAADAVVLATGNQAPAALPWTLPASGYIADPWAPGALDTIDDDAPVLIVGTGLTMVDLAMSLTRCHPDRTVYAVSRHGMLPRPHRLPRPPAAPIVLPAERMNLRELLRWARQTVRANGGEWHGVVDAVRPHVQDLWADLSEPDRRRFLNRIARYWEVHRHRIPPVTAARIDELRATGRLRVLRGRIDGVQSADDCRFSVRVHHDDEVLGIRVGWLINGTGPAAAPATDPFLHGLTTAGIARPGPLGLGLDAEADGAVRDAAGHPHQRLFTLGPTLRGLHYETTAIPEIRAQAAALARRLAAIPGRRTADQKPRPFSTRIS